MQIQHLIKFAYQLLFSFEVSCGVVLTELKSCKESFHVALLQAIERNSWSEGWRKLPPHSNWNVCLRCHFPHLS